MSYISRRCDLFFNSICELYWADGMEWGELQLDGSGKKKEKEREQSSMRSFLCIIFRIVVFIYH